MSYCAVCAKLGKTCCQKTDVLLTSSDVQRIENEIGRSDFVEHRKPRDPESLGAEEDPNWLLFTLRSDGSRTVVRQRANGDCLFLAPRGCSLPAEARPLICRLHPLTYTENGITGASVECPATVLAGRNPLEAIGMDVESGQRLRKQLYSELRDDLIRLSRPQLRPAIFSAKRLESTT